MTDRTPYCHKVRYGVTGFPILTEDEMDGSHAPGVGIAPALIELIYSAPHDGKPASVSASVTGAWTRFGRREDDSKDDQVTTHFKNGPDGWPGWLAAEARLHDPDTAATPSVPADADLRDRMVRALDAAFASFDPERTEDAELAGHLADAVLAVLPESRRPFDAQAGLQRLADSPAPGEMYRHYKGGLYTVLAVAEDTGTGAPVVVYHDEERRVWARPLAEFAGTVADEVWRFTLEGEPAGLPAPADRATLKPMFEGLARLLATSSRDWGTYRVDAWLYAVLVGWDCERTEHDETCVHGAMEETAQRHGWDADTVAKARRYRAAVRRTADEMQQACSHPEGYEGECPCPPSCACCVVTAAGEAQQAECACDPAPHRQPDGTYSHLAGCPVADAEQLLDERVAAAKEQPVGLPPQLQAALDVMAKRGRVVELTAQPEIFGPEVVAYRHPTKPRAYLCRQHGDGQPGLTPLEADDLPDGGLCDACGVDVLIPQQQAGEGR